MKIEKDNPEYVYYLVGQNLKKLRKQAKLSIVKFANLCNYSEGFIMNIESPKYLQTFSLDTLWKFSKVLKVDIKYFFQDLDEE